MPDCVNNYRVCMYTPSAHGGHPLYSQELLRALVRHDGDHFELVSSEDLEPPYRQGDYPIHPILPALARRESFRSKLGWMVNRALHYPRRERAFLRYLASRPDISIVHVQEQRPWLARMLFRGIRRLGKKLFYTVHNIRPNTFAPLLPRRMILRWNRNACLMCDGLFVLSETLRQQLSGFLGNPHPPIHVAPHGIWTEHAQLADRMAALGRIPSIAQRLAWRKLLFFGTIRRNKGLHVLLAAMQQLPQVSLTIIGEPREPDYVTQEIAPLVQRLQQIGRAIDFRPRYMADDELPDLFATHSAVVMPYTREFAAQSGAAFMALSQGIPLIASDAGGLGEVFAEFDLGSRIAEVNPAETADAIGRFFAADHPHLQSQLAAARRHYSWDTCAKRTIEAYQSIGSSRPLSDGEAHLAAGTGTAAASLAARN